MVCGMKEASPPQVSVGHWMLLGRRMLLNALLRHIDSILYEYLGGEHRFFLPIFCFFLEKEGKSHTDEEIIRVKGLATNGKRAFTKKEQGCFH